MARCAYHPDVETEMACMECAKPICPKEMVLTPVGYKCPDCARPARSQYTYVKPKQLVRAVAAGLAVGIAGALLLALIRWGGIFLGILWGSATAEAVRRASGGHRGATVGAAAVGGITVGWFLSGAIGGVWWGAAIIAGLVALVQLSVLGSK